eukprot:8946236-Pyramimonas_sp.AAC.1
MGLSSVSGNWLCTMSLHSQPFANALANAVGDERELWLSCTGRQPTGPNPKGTMAVSPKSHGWIRIA